MFVKELYTKCPKKVERFLFAGIPQKLKDDFDYKLKKIDEEEIVFECSLLGGPFDVIVKDFYVVGFLSIEEGAWKTKGSEDWRKIMARYFGKDYIDAYLEYVKKERNNMNEESDRLIEKHIQDTNRKLQEMRERQKCNLIAFDEKIQKEVDYLEEISSNHILKK